MSLARIIETAGSDGAALTDPYGHSFAPPWRAYLHRRLLFAVPGTGTLFYVSVIFATGVNWRQSALSDNPGWHTWPVGPFVVALHLQF